MTIRPKIAWFAAFTAVFAVGAAWLFWGTWSPDFSPVMPDDQTSHTMSYAALVHAALSRFLESGRLIPSDLVWDGLAGSKYLLQEFKYALALYCSGLGLAYFLIGRGLARPAAYGAGLLLSFCGYWATLFSAGHGGWFVWMTYGVFAFGLADRAVRVGKARHWILLGACVAWAGFYQPDLWLMFTVFTGAYFAWCCVRERKFPWKGMLVAAAVFAAVGAPSLISAVGAKLDRDQTIAKEKDSGSSLTGGADKSDKDARWIFVTNWSLPTDEIAEFFIARLNGDTSCPLCLSMGWRHGRDIKPYSGAIGRPYGAKQGNYRQHSVYVGWMTCLLALAGVVFGLRRRPRGEVIFFTASAVACLLLSLGRYCEPVYRLVFALPVGDTIRCPVKWHHLTEFCLCVLAAYGIAGLWSLAKVRWVRVLIIAAVLVGTFDLVRQDRVFCIPVDHARARRMDADESMAVLRKQDFANPQLAERVRSGQVVSLANYLGNPDYYLVQMLSPRKPFEWTPLPPAKKAAWLGGVSVISTLMVMVGSVFLVVRRR